MKIVAEFSRINTLQELLDNFFYRSVLALAEQQESFEFFFVVNESLSSKILYLPNNVKKIVLKDYLGIKFIEPISNSLQLSRKLNKIKPTYFFSNNLSELKKQSFFQVSRVDFADVLNKKKIEKKITHSNYIIAANDWVKKNLLSNFVEIQDRIIVLEPAVDKLLPFTFEDRQLVKKTYTKQKDFFLVHELSTEANFIMTLKAFSLFKKWQQSSMQLVVVCKKQKIKIYENKLSNYKYKGDVIISDESSDNSYKLAQSAYASIFIQNIFSVVSNMLQAQQANIPILLPKSDYFDAVFKDTALYTELNEKKLSEAMIELYKDENQRNKLILKGAQLQKKTEWKDVANNLWSYLSE